MLRRFLHGLILTALLCGVMIVLAQDNWPPFPADTTDSVLLPNSLTFGQLNQTDPKQSYVLLVGKGDKLQLTMRRTGGNITPILQLLSLDGQVLMDAKPGDLAGRTTTIDYVAEEDAWLRVIATRQETDSSEGNYTLVVDGTTPTLYKLVPAGVPPTLDSLVLLQSGKLAGRLQADKLTYQIPLNSGETLHLSIDAQKSSTLALADAAAKVLSKSDASNTLSYTATETGWYVLTIEPSAAGNFTLDIAIDHPLEVAMAGAALSDLITLTPSLTPTPSPTFTATFTPTETPTPTLTFTATFTPTDTLTPSATFTPSITPTPSDTPTASPTFTPSSTFTPSNTPTRTSTPSRTPTRPPTSTPTRTRTPVPSATGQAVCGGKSTPFTVGQSVIVDFNTGGALRILNNYEGSARQTLVQAYDGHILDLVDGPECSKGIWYWKVFFPRQNVYGWAAEGDNRPFMCPLDHPECR